jgi:hypothetical protein
MMPAMNTRMIVLASGGIIPRMAAIGKMGLRGNRRQLAGLLLMR